MQLKSLQNIIGQKNKKKLHFLLFLNFLNFLFELSALASLAVFGSFLVNKNYLYEKFDINLQNFIDEKNQLVYLGLIVIIIFLIKNIFYFLLIFIQTNFVKNIKIEISKKVYSKYIKGSYKKHLSQSPSIFTRDLTESIKSLGVYILCLIDLFREIVAALSIYALLLFVDFKIVSISTIFLIIISIFFIIFIKNNLKTRAAENFKIFEKYIKDIHNSFSAIKEIKIFKKEEITLENFKKNLFKFEKNSRLFLLLEKIPKTFLEIFSIIFLTSFCFYFFKNSENNTDLIIILSVFIIAMTRMIPAFSAITSNFNFLRIYEPAVSKINKEILDFDDANKEKYIEKNIYQKNLDVNKNLIIVDNLYFNYHPEKKNLVNVNMQIAEGEYHCILGETGSGKSTLFNIILGLLSPNKGGIYYKNQNIHLDLNKWHNNLALVSQDPYLMQESIAKNISFEFSENNIDYKRLEEAIKIAEIDNFIFSLKNGLNTEVKAFSKNLSGGEKQRIAIARAVYRNSPILLLDEFTNALDSETEKKILNNLKNQKNKTLIMISHKQSTIENCDKIWKLENGHLNKLS
jgi:ATP-binding cassette, subfamily B, bacterial PglK